MSSVFVARQPIFTKNQQVFAYELLFRCAKEHTTCQASDGNQATARLLIDNLLELGFDELTNNHTAFVNFPAELLLAPFVEELPLDMIVIEILETVLPTPAIIDRCRDLKAKGAQLALDDFILTPQYQELAALADYIKIDSAPPICTHAARWRSPCPDLASFDRRKSRDLRRIQRSHQLRLRPDTRLFLL